MTSQIRKWKRNTEGLYKTAQEKARATQHRVEEAIRILVKEKRTINFKTVAETAHVSTAWLYGNEDIKMRIIHLRRQQDPKVQVRIPKQDQASNASKDAIIAALQNRVKEQATKIRELEKQLEVTTGELQRLYLIKE